MEPYLVEPYLVEPYLVYIVEEFMSKLYSTDLESSTPVIFLELPSITK